MIRPGTSISKSRDEADDADPNRDLGLGSVVAQQSRERFLNRDGTFNVERTGLPFLPALSPYYSLLELSWGAFFLLIAASYLLVNAIFALLYLLCGPGALVGMNADMPTFLQTFFFSIQTFSSIGYGGLAPASLAANLITTAEAVVDVIFIALATGITFARFSRPTSGIVYSKNAVVAPYRDHSGLMFRIVNERKSQIIELTAKVTLSRFETEAGQQVRRFYSLDLERDKVAFFPLALTLVHPIGEGSPLYDVSEAELLRSDAEILILITGVDDTFSQMVHSRSSYKAEEVLWGVRFVSLYSSKNPGSKVSIDVRKLSKVEKV